MTDVRQALVLDFGGVISRTLFETHDVTERALGLPAGTLGWRGPFGPETDPLWRAMQRDEITERDYWRTRTREVGALLGEEWTAMDTFVRRARGAEPEAVIRPEALAAIAAVRAAGLKVAVLSNELDLFYGAEFRTRLPFMAGMDAVVDATYTGILKPDPRAYAAVCAELDLTPSACVFVDDQERNWRGALAAGMRAVLFDVARPAASYSQALTLLGLDAAAIPELDHA
jgi:putative hydrolase of the HAD superfamily